MRQPGTAHRDTSLVALRDAEFVIVTITTGGLEAAGGRDLPAGDVLVLGDDVIHSVANTRREFAMALHVYGGNFFTVERSEWDFDPWAGDVVDGEVRGRGAQDMKGQVAAEVAAAATLARDGWRPERGALKVVITADEETGGGKGARWLCEEHPEAVRSDLVVNEGGGKSFELGGRRFYALAVGEKGVARFHLRARGRRGQHREEHRRHDQKNERKETDLHGAPPSARSER